MIYRKTIRIHGKEKKSPRFARKADADVWYHAQFRIKQFLKDGVTPPASDKTTLAEYFHTRWLPSRKKRGYPKSTWGADEQRFTDYVEEDLGHLAVSKISQLQVRQCIRAVVEVDGMSIKTRNHVRTLLSTIFNDAQNEDPALRTDNPAIGISFNDPREGVKAPPHLRKESEILAFMRAAKKLSPVHWVYANIALMAGPRKQEMVAFRWNDFSAESHELVIDEKFIQAENKIVDGTKAGTSEARIVPIPDALVEVLKKWHDKTDWPDPEHFILSRPDGKHFHSREIHTIHDDIRKLSGVSITPHGLRHSFGRLFIKNGGSKEALQTILGHSSMAVTELYSSLAGDAVKKHRNVVSLETGGEE